MNTRCSLDQAMADTDNGTYTAVDGHYSTLVVAYAFGSNAMYH